MNKSILNKYFYILLVFFTTVIISCQTNVESEPELISIEVQSNQIKNEYIVGEKLDLTGLVVVAKFSDETAVEVKDYLSIPAEGTEFTENGNQKIKITYNGRDSDIEVKVLSSIATFQSQPQNKIIDLYKNAQLDCKIKSEISGNIKFLWFKKNIINSMYNVFNESDIIEVEKGKEYTSSIVLPQTDFLNTEYYCEVKIIHDSYEYHIKSEICTVKQEVNTWLPLLKINTKDNIAITSKEEYVKASFSLTSKIYEELDLSEIQIKGRGNTSWSAPKKPYTLKFDKKNEVLGMNKSKKWVLVANYFDKSLMRNYYVSLMSNNILDKMKWNPSFQFVDLVLNDEYLGTYIIGEQIKIEENRVNIQNVADSIKGKGSDLNSDGVIDEKDGGFLVEINARMDEAFNFQTKQNRCISLKDPDVEDFKGNEQKVEQYVIDIIQNAEDVLYSDDWLDSENGYKKYIDIDSFIDWWIINELTKNNDACWFSSVYMYYDPKYKKLYMGPNWDFDISCGNIDYNGCDDCKGFWIKNSGWHGRLFTDPDFISKAKIRWNSVKSDIYKSINEDIRNTSYILTKSSELNFKRWPILGTYVWPNAPGYENRVLYDDEIFYLVNWLNNRYVWMDNQIQQW